MRADGTDHDKGHQGGIGKGRDGANGVKRRGKNAVGRVARDEGRRGVDAAEKAELNGLAGAGVAGAEGKGAVETGAGVLGGGSGASVGVGSGSAKCEYFVKWRGLSHAHNSWVDEEWLGSNAPRELAVFKARAATVECSPTWNPQWSQPRKLIAKRVTRPPVRPGAGRGRGRGYRPDWGVEFFVLWRGLGYEQCTWEPANGSVLQGSAGRGLVARYWEREQGGVGEGGEGGRGAEWRAALEQGALCAIPDHSAPHWIALPDAPLQQQLGNLNALRGRWKACGPLGGESGMGARGRRKGSRQQVGRDVLLGSSYEANQLVVAAFFATHSRDFHSQQSAHLPSPSPHLTTATTANATAATDAASMEAAPAATAATAGRMRPSLLVVPGSAVAAWEGLLEQRVPGLSVTVLRGSEATREVIKRWELKKEAERGGGLLGVRGGMGDGGRGGGGGGEGNGMGEGEEGCVGKMRIKTDVVITTPVVFSMEQSYLQEVAWGAIVADSSMPLWSAHETQAARSMEWPLSLFSLHACLRILLSPLLPEARKWDAGDVILMTVA
ncbi:hypothetical protein CLOM_g13823 [Closterium sp. NIES-68]|nr:hypothetical protein CLOM_g13823 [Closterium sp. NIES-68]